MPNLPSDEGFENCRRIHARYVLLGKQNPEPFAVLYGHCYIPDFHRRENVLKASAL